MMHDAMQVELILRTESQEDRSHELLLVGELLGDHLATNIGEIQMNELAIHFVARAPDPFVTDESGDKGCSGRRCDLQVLRQLFHGHPFMLTDVIKHMKLHEVKIFPFKFLGHGVVKNAAGFEGHVHRFTEEVVGCCSDGKRVHVA